jgi:hypothetical protein
MKWTKTILDKTSNTEFTIKILQEKLDKLTNPDTPLGLKLKQSIAELQQMDQENKQIPPSNPPYMDTPIDDDSDEHEVFIKFSAEFDVIVPSELPLPN